MSCPCRRASVLTTRDQSRSQDTGIHQTASPHHESGRRFWSYCKGRTRKIKHPHLPRLLGYPLTNVEIGNISGPALDQLLVIRAAAKEKEKWPQKQAGLLRQKRRSQSPSPTWPRTATKTEYDGPSELLPCSLSHTNTHRIEWSNRCPARTIWMKLRRGFPQDR